MTDTATNGEAATPSSAQRTGGVGVTIARNSLWLMVDSLAGLVASFYCSIAVARSLGPDLMGQYNYILYFATVLRMVTEVAMPSTVRKFAAEFMGRGDYSAVRTVLSRALWLQTRLATAGLTLGMAVVFTAFPREQRWVAALAVLSIVPGLFLSIPAGALWATGNLRQNVASSMVSTIANVVGVTASLLLNWGMVGLTASLLVSRAIDCLLRFDLFRRHFSQLPGRAQPGPLQPALRARMFRFARQQLVLTLLYALLFDRMEVLFLRSLAPNREIAFFSISMTVVYYLLMVPQNLAGSASVTVWVQQGRSPHEAARTTAVATWFVAIVATPLLLGMAAVSEPLLRVLYGARYLPAIPVLIVLSVSGLGLAISQPAQYLLVGAERQKFYMAGMGIAAIVDVVGCLLLIPRYGALGAAMAKGSAQLVAASIFLTYLQHGFGARLPVARMARLILSGGAMLLCVLLFSRRVASILGLLLGIPLGAGIFVVLVRILRCLDVADRDRLRGLERLIPAPVRHPYRSVVDFLVPA